MTFLVARSNPIDMLATYYRGESTMNSAMAVLILPMAAEIFEYKGDTKLAQRAGCFDKGWQL